MKRLTLLLAAGAALAGALAALPAGAATKTVTLTDYRFTPKKQRIAKGDRVRFEWAGDADHNVTFRRVPKGAKRPGRCRTRDTGACRRKFRKVGTYRYVCTIHELTDGMRGRVVVKARQRPARGASAASRRVSPPGPDSVPAHSPT